jgi:hypothetical protein
MICILDQVVQDLYENNYITKADLELGEDNRMIKIAKKNQLMVSIKHLSEINVMRSL